MTDGIEDFTNESDIGNLDSILAFQEFITSNPYEAVKAVDKRAVGRSFYQLAKVYYDKADLVLAEEYFIKALECADRPRDNFAVFKTLGFLIRISSELQDDLKAGKYIKEAELVLEELDCTLGTLNAEYFYNVGTINTYIGNFEEAKSNYMIAHRKAQEENELELLSKCLLSLATNSYNIKDFDSAIEYIHQLTQLLKVVNKGYLRGAMYMLSGKVLLEKKQYEAALSFFKKSNAQLQDKKCWNLYGYNLLWIGTVYKRRGEFDKALLIFELAFEIIDKSYFKRLNELLRSEIDNVNDESVDIYLDRVNRRVREKVLGVIDFKHRFVLLEILFLLAKNPGRFYDKEQLAKSIWKDEYNPLIHDKLIYTSVSRLRKLIEPKGNNKNSNRKYILRGKDGYTFNQRVNTRFYAENKEEIGHSIANIELSSPV